MATLLVTDPRSDLERLRATKGHSVTGSCIWLFGTDDYLSWKDAGPQTLWINGGAGMGKTMLMMVIIDELTRIYPSPFEPLPSRTLAYFFCDRNGPRLRTATSVLRGLFFNLTAYGRHQFSGTINGMFQHIRGFGEDVNTFYATAKIMQDAIKVASGFGCRITFAVDGLDECEEGLPQLLDFIGHTVTWFGVKWLISSRPRLDVKDQLTRAGRLWDLSLEHNAKFVSPIVELYIDTTVKAIAEAKRLDKKTTCSIIRSLKSGANGTFLWVSHVCKALENAPRYKAASIPSTLPDGLRATYRHMMDQVDKNDEETMELCKRILNGMSATTRPVGLDQVGRLAMLPDEIANDIESVKDLVYRCGDFLVISDENVSLVHRPSVTQYLLSDDGVRFGRLDLVDKESLYIIEKGGEEEKLLDY